MRGDVAAVREALTLLAPRIEAATEEALALVVADLQARLEPDTPRTTRVKTHMQDVYSHQVVGTTAYVFNDQFYSNWVIWGTARSRDNPALQAVVRSAPEEFEVTLSAILDQLVAGVP